MLNAQTQIPEEPRVLRSHLPRASTVLMVGLTACFALQQVVIVHLEKHYDVYLTLSGYGMKSGHLWELFTYQFFHAGWTLSTGLVHLLVNLAALWFFGRDVESRLGTGRFLALYLGASFAGAVLQGLVAVAGFWLPESAESVAMFLRDRFGGPLAGSSVGLCGVFAAFCLLQPERRIHLLFLIPVKAVHLLWMALGIAVVLVVIPSNPDLAHLGHLGNWLHSLAVALTNPDLPHIAHLVGLLAGMVFVKCWRPAGSSGGASLASL